PVASRQSPVASRKLHLRRQRRLVRRRVVLRTRFFIPSGRFVTMTVTVQNVFPGRHRIGRWGIGRVVWAVSASTWIISHCSTSSTFILDGGKSRPRATLLQLHGLWGSI